MMRRHDSARIIGDIVKVLNSKPIDELERRLREVLGLLLEGDEKDIDELFTIVTRDVRSQIESIIPDPSATENIYRHYISSLIAVMSSLVVTLSVRTDLLRSYPMGVRILSLLLWLFSNTLALSLLIDNIYDMYREMKQMLVTEDGTELPYPPLDSALRTVSELRQDLANMSEKTRHLLDIALRELAKAIIMERQTK